jgi:hypothetical protein
VFIQNNVISESGESRKIWMGHVACMGKMRSVFRILVGENLKGRPLGRPRYRWTDNIVMELMEIVWEGVVWVHVAWDRDWWKACMNTVMNLWSL